ncbi:unnamed protein product [Caenorhabditis sp. 36 PRJEB53466]|nr:unnamed protein product [Caenorhabditis sp. 36 PRJEB53466]
MTSKKLLKRFSSSVSDLLKIQKNGLEDDEEFYTPLQFAIKIGNSIMVKNFVDSKSVWIDEPNNKGRTALHSCIVHGNIELASVLLAGGANVDCVDFDGISPCHLACKNGMIDHFNLLLYYHADICSVNRTGRTPFDLACEYGQEKMLEVILNCGIKTEKFQSSDENHTASAFHLAAANGHVQVMTVLLHHSWDINTKTNEGSALHLAAGFGRVQSVRFLLKSRIDGSIKNANGMTAYEWAKKTNCRNPITFKEIHFLLKNFHTFTDAIALKNHCGVKADELCFSKGDKVWIINRSDQNLWKGIVFGQKGNSRSGYFDPSTVVEESEAVLQILPPKVMRSRTDSSEMKSFAFCGTTPLGLDQNGVNRIHMTSFGKPSMPNRKLLNFRSTSTKSSSGAIGSDAHELFYRQQSTTPFNMYASTTSLHPSKVDMFSPPCTSPSHSSSGFESMKCSTSTSASSFPSAVQTNEYEPTLSIHSAESCRLAIKKLKEFQRNCNSNVMNSPQNNLYYVQADYYHAPRSKDRAHQFNDPPPPAPVFSNQPKLRHCKEIDYFSYQNNYKNIPKVAPEKQTSPASEKMNFDPFLSRDTPIRLNLVSTGKLLNGISKLEQNIDSTLTQKVTSPVQHNHRTSYSCSKQTTSFHVPTSLPPLLLEDHPSDHSSTSSLTKLSMDELLEDIQSAMRALTPL